MRRSSIGMLLAGIGLVIGSCVPVAQLLWGGGSEPVLSMSVPPRGGTAPLSLSEPLTVAPVAVIRAAPAAGNAALSYQFSVVDDSGGELLRENGTAALETAAGGTEAGLAATLAVRLPRLTLPAGRWTVGWHAGDGADLIQGAEVRLLRPSTGPVGLLLTSLVLAILGWLTASLGALRWIRTEAARPAADGSDRESGEQQRLWVVGCHLIALTGYLVPFGHVLGPLMIWLARRRICSEIELAGRDALNFQLSMTLYVLAALLLSFFLIGLVVLFLLVVLHFTAVLAASLRARRGLDARYPLVLTFI